MSKAFKLQVFMLPTPSADHMLYEVEFDAPEGYRLHSWQGVTDREPMDGGAGRMHGVAAVLWQQGTESVQLDEGELAEELQRMLTDG